MSYDLYLEPRSGAVDRARMFEFVGARPNYRIEGPQAFYENEDTGVYFSFEENEVEGEGESEVDDDAKGFRFLFHLNFYRPSPFILEAEPEVTAVVQEFDCGIHDPQEDMPDGVYCAERLIEGWRRGNEFAFQTILGREDRPESLTLPAARLTEVWRWNHRRNALQASIGETKFVPRILFFRVQDELATAAVWPDGLSTLLPTVDYVLCTRSELAPRRMLRKEADMAIMRHSELIARLAEHHSTPSAGLHDFDWETPPKEVIRFVKGLPTNELALQGVAFDSVLDRELVEKYVP